MRNSTFCILFVAVAMTGGWFWRVAHEFGVPDQVEFLAGVIFLGLLVAWLERQMGRNQS